MHSQKHLITYAGAHYGASSYYAVQYGCLRDVYASNACNYSYREFWF